jgi:hypothetical protein
MADLQGRVRAHNDVALPSPEWFWVTDWTLERRGAVDKDGWEVGREYINSPSLSLAHTHTHTLTHARTHTHMY